MNRWVNSLRWLVRVLAGIAGAALLTLMLVTTIDVILRAFRHPIPGAYDLVKVAAGVAIAATRASGSSGRSRDMGGSSGDFARGVTRLV